LEASFSHDPEGYGTQQHQFVTELSTQRETIASFLSNILTDSDPVVKRVLVSTSGSLEELCTYFGKTKAHDILLSHLITFLNDKGDWHLRVAFFRCVPAVASYIGWHAAPLLIPLLKQGLADVEEFVMREALISIRSLAEINFFGHRFLLELLDEVIPFVIHPNLWLRNASVGVITTIKKNLSEVDVHCHVIPRLKVYLNPTANSIWGLNEVSILTKVRKPLDRQVYESCARAKGALLGAAIEYLRNHDGKGSQPDTNEVANVSNVFLFSVP
jgi:phosphoinositide-3-kinase regulatory subunit 4